MAFERKKDTAVPVFSLRSLTWWRGDANGVEGYLSFGTWLDSWLERASGNETNRCDSLVSP